MNELTLVTLQPFGAKAAATLGWEANAEMAAGFQQLVDAMVADSGLLQLSTAHLSPHQALQFLGLVLITLPVSMLDAAVKAHRKEARKVTV
jgi:hypothetical protein